jgi:type IV fimbrial biogenesis protein FimT
MGSAPATGFTMIELMVVVVVMAVLLGVAVPSFQAVMNANRLAGASNELMASLQTARMEAVKRNARVGLCLSKGSNSTAPVCSNDDVDGWIVFVDASKDDKYDSGTDTLLRTSTAASNVVVTASATPATAGAIVFRADGFARKKKDSADLLYGTIDMCIKTRRPPENVRHVIIAAGSRVSVESADANAACATPDDKPDET